MYSRKYNTCIIMKYIQVYRCSQNVAMIDILFFSTIVHFPPIIWSVIRFLYKKIIYLILQISKTCVYIIYRSYVWVEEVLSVDLYFISWNRIPVLQLVNTIIQSLKKYILHVANGFDGTLLILSIIIINNTISCLYMHVQAHRGPLIG